MATVAMLGHCQKFYDLLDSKAEDTPQEGRVYEGKITDEFNATGLAAPYYSRIMRSLQDMGCVHQLQRGGRATPSRWQLYYRPTEELYGQIDPRETNVAAIHEKIRVYQASVDQRTRDLGRRVEGMDTSLNQVVAAIAGNTTTIQRILEHLGLSQTDTPQPPTKE